MTTISPVATPMSDPLVGLVTTITEAVVGVVAELTKALGGGASALGTGQGAQGADIALGGPEARGSSDLPTGTLDALAGALAPTEAAAPAPAPTPPAPDAGPGRKAADNAKKYEGTPYKWGGAAPGGFDCSGLTMTALKEAGITVPRTSQEQFKGGTPVEKGDLRPGDLVFFEGDPPGHVGIYAGDGKVTHAPTTGDVVKTVPLEQAGRYTGARRYT